MRDWIMTLAIRQFEVVKRSDEPKGFVVLPKRWILESTSTWLGRYWRLSKDYEQLPETSGSMIYAALIRLMLKRLARHPAAVLWHFQDTLLHGSTGRKSVAQWGHAETLWARMSSGCFTCPGDRRFRPRPGQPAR